MKKYIIIGIIIVIAVIALAAGYLLFWGGQQSTLPSPTADTAEEEPTGFGAGLSQDNNPTQNLPSTNPFEATANPLQSQTNPFEGGYTNPFSQ